MNEEKKLLELLGGEQNISVATHCMTRLRLVLNDTSLANIEEIEKLSIVKGTFTQAGQFQIIIGNNVAQVYKELIKGTNIQEATKEDAKAQGSKKMNVFQKFSTFMSEIFAPIIPAIIVGGLILGFRNIIEIPYGFMDGVALTEQYQFFAGLDSYLWLIGEAIFMFLPVHICWSTYKKLGGTPVLGIVLGITLVSPQLLSAYDVASTPVADIPVWDFGFAQIKMIGYQAQVIPALLVGMFGAVLEGKLSKITPNSVQMIVVPFVVLIATTLMANIVIGPFGWFIGTLIAQFVTWLLSTLGFLGGAIFGFFYAPLVITGLHHMTNAIDMQIIAEYGSTPLWPLIALSNIAQASAVLAFVFLKKNASDRELTVPSTISAYLGVTEPAMFGVNLKYSYAFICAMIGSALAGGFSTLMGVQSVSIGVGGLPGILSIRPEDMFSFFIAMLIAIVVPFTLTVIMFKRKNQA